MYSLKKPQIHKTVKAQPTSSLHRADHAPRARSGRRPPDERSGRQVAPSGRLPPREAWARWTGRGGGNQKRAAEAAPRSPPFQRCARYKLAGRGRERLCQLRSELGHRCCFSSKRRAPPPRSVRSRPPWRRRHEVSGRRPEGQALGNVKALSLRHLTLLPDRAGG